MKKLVEFSSSHWQVGSSGTWQSSDRTLWRVLGEGNR
jgi:hypothetical protein